MMTNENSNNLLLAEDFESLFDFKMVNIPSQTADSDNNSISLDLPLIKMEADDRIVALVDSPVGSPSTCGSPSPSLPISAEPKINTQFNFSSITTDFTFYDNDGYDIKDSFEPIKSALQDSPCRSPVSNGLLLGQTLAIPETDTNMEMMSTETTDFSDLDKWLAEAANNAELPQAVLNMMNSFGDEGLQTSEVSSTVNAILLPASPYVKEEEFELNEIISDRDLLTLSVKELNRRLANQPKSIQQKLKAKRRTLKNRGYAQNCRTKRVRNQEDLERDNHDMAQQLVVSQHENKQLKQKLSKAFKLINHFQAARVENDTNQAEISLLRNEVTNLRQENQQLQQQRQNGYASSTASSPAGSLEELCE